MDLSFIVEAVESGIVSMNANTDCPHCQRAVNVNVQAKYIVSYGNRKWYAYHYSCPSCRNPVIILVAISDSWDRELEVVQAYPRLGRPVPPEVPDPYRSDFREASLVLHDSPKASAALSRRCLQLLLRNVVGVKPGTLSEEIEQAVNSNKIPSDIAADLHYVREIGNLAAHPSKDERTDAIVDVEPGEAEYLLDVIESLFDVLFVTPARRAQRRRELRAKLESVGRKLPDWVICQDAGFDGRDDGARDTRRD